jgi:hypothetical protein
VIRARAVDAGSNRWSISVPTEPKPIYRLRDFEENSLHFGALRELLELEELLVPPEPPLERSRRT